MNEVDDVLQNPSVTSKSRYWVGVLWLKNLRSDWIDQLDSFIQNPYEYCIHDKDVDSEGLPREPHVHLMIAFPNTTTYKHALSIFQSFSSSSGKCCNTCFRVLNVRFMHNYLIHDTENARSKHQYDPSERVSGLDFDIGFLEQLSSIDKRNMLIELSKHIVDNRITNYLDFFTSVLENFDMSYVDLLYSYSGHFERLCKGCYLKVSSSTLKSESSVLIPREVKTCKCKVCGQEKPSTEFSWYGGKDGDCVGVCRSCSNTL